MHQIIKQRTLTKIVSALRPRAHLPAPCGLAKFGIPTGNSFGRGGILQPKFRYTDYDMFTKPYWDEVRPLATALRVAVVDRLAGKIVPAIRTDFTMRRWLGVDWPGGPWLGADGCADFDVASFAADIAASVLQWGECYNLSSIKVVSIDGMGVTLDPNTFEPKMSLCVDFIYGSPCASMAVANLPFCC
jgi:hypothetical protein